MITGTHIVGAGWFAWPAMPFDRAMIAKQAQATALKNRAEARFIRFSLTVYSFPGLVVRLSRKRAF